MMYTEGIIQYQLTVRCVLCTGRDRFQGLHCHSGSSAPHNTGLLEDALGVQREGMTPRHLWTQQGVLQQHTFVVKNFKRANLTSKFQLSSGFSLLRYLWSCVFIGHSDGLSRIRDGKGNTTVFHNVYTFMFSIWNCFYIFWTDVPVDGISLCTFLLEKV